LKFIIINVNGRKMLSVRGVLCVVRMDVFMFMDRGGGGGEKIVVMSDWSVTLINVVFAKRMGGRGGWLSIIMVKLPVFERQTTGG